MTRSETLAIMYVLNIAYPNFYKGKSGEDADRAADLWREMFADDSAELVTCAVKSFIATDTKGFPPSIGIIKNKIADMRNPGGMTEYEAWNRIKEAVSNGIYGSREEFDRLPPILQKLVGSPNKLREWAQMESSTLESVVGSNFMRSYRARAANEREYAMLPSEIQKFMSMLAEKMNLNALQPKQLTEADINDRRNEIHRLLEGGKADS